MAKRRKRIQKRPRPPVAPIAKDEAGEFDPSFGDLRADAKRRREEFCREYIKDFNASEAVRRMGYKSKTPWVMASEWMKEPYTQFFLDKMLRALDRTAIVSANEILAGLKKEAHYYGMDGGAAARISAWRSLGKMLGLEVTKIEGNVNLGGGVMLMPFSGSPDEWEKAASKAQKNLKETVRQ